MWNVFLAMSRPMVLSAVGVLVLLTLMLYQLQSLTPGLSQTELATYDSSRKISSIIDNPVNAPYKISIFISTIIIDNSLGLRIVGAMTGVLAIVLFYIIAIQIYGQLIAVSTSIMLASSTYFLALTRSATGNVMLLSLLVLLSAGAYIRFGKRKDVGWIVAAIVLGLSIYVPGMLVFIIPLAAWQFMHVRKTFERLQPPIIIASSVIFGVLCIPLLVSLIREPSLWRDYLGLPAILAPLNEIIGSIGAAIASLFAVSKANPSIWLGRQPILDVFAAVMFLYGVISLIGKYKLDRLWILVAIFCLGLIWVGIAADPLKLFALLPFIYLVIGFGLQRLVNQWMSVFPKNPIARYVGTALFVIAVATSVNFQLHRYFVAWPNNNETKQVMNHELPTSNSRQ